MSANNDHLPGFVTLLRKIGRTGLGAIQNRGELVAVEWQEENARLTEMLVWAFGLAFLAMTGVLLLTATIILLFPANSEFTSSRHSRCSISPARSRHGSMLKRF